MPTIATSKYRVLLSTELICAGDYFYAHGASRLPSDLDLVRIASTSSLVGTPAGVYGAGHYWRLISQPIDAAPSKKWSCGHKREDAAKACVVCAFMGRVTTT